MAAVTRRKIIVLIISLIPCLTFSKITFRDTFEDTPEWKGWYTSTLANGLWERVTENAANDFASQSHGLKSLLIKDPDGSSYAYASTIFVNDAYEYMIEFYTLIPDRHVYVDSFPLCILQNSMSSRNTDVSLFVTSTSFGLEIYVADSSGIFSNVTYIDTLNRWYKIQIHRYRKDNKFFVALYLDGQLKGTFVPMDAGYVSDQIRLGSTSAPSSVSGEVFYDDFIVSSPPRGEHPRLLFNQYDMSSLLERTGGGNTYLGVDYAYMWDSLRSYTDHLIKASSGEIVWKKRYNDGNDSLVDIFMFPYPQFRFIPRKDFDHLDFWLGPQRRLASQLMALSFVAAVDKGLRDEREHAKDIVVSLAHWQMWNDPYFKGWYGRKYIQLGVGHFMFSIALTYDWLFDYLSDYERMSIQNSLINLGINQSFLEACCGEGWGNNPREWPNGTAVIMGGMGIACLSLDDCGLDLELETARARVYGLLDDDTVCNRAGAYAEGISYGGYAVDHIVTFCEADNALSDFIENNGFLSYYPKWRIWSMLPGAEDYYGYQYYPPTYWDVTFCDYDVRGGKWTTAIARLADLTRDSEARWFLKKRKDLGFSEQNSRYDRWDLYLPFGLLLWTDKSRDVSMPEPDTLLRIFRPAGWAIARTGWRDTDYILALKSGQWFRNHNHHEQGSFVFGGHGRWLVADMGYATNDAQKTAAYHNVLFEKNSEILYWSDHDLQSHFVLNETNSYSIIKTGVQSGNSGIGSWQRSIVFFNNSGCFAMMDYAETSRPAEAVSWQIHTWVEPVLPERDNTIAISYPGGPSLMGLIVYPQDLIISHQILDRRITYREVADSSRIYRFNRLSADLRSGSETYNVVAGFVPYHFQETAGLESVSGMNFEGVVLRNESESTVVMFRKDPRMGGGNYSLSVADTMFNVVVNLLPNTHYSISLRKGGTPEVNLTKLTSSVGTLDFTVDGKGTWQIAITLHR